MSGFGIWRIEGVRGNVRPRTRAVNIFVWELRRNCMRYEERVLAYIDILRFKNAVNNTIKEDGNDNFHEIQRIDNILNELQWQSKYKDYLISNEFPIGSKVTTQFSDSIIISYLKTENIGIYRILLDIYFLCITAMQNGFLFRGAVVNGKVIHTKEKIFGPAYLKAYEMEQKKAIFPRVIIDDDVIAIAKNNYSKCANPDAEYNDLLKLIPCDFDGIRYIDYVNKLYTGVGVGEEEEHRILIGEIIKKMEEDFNTDTGVKCKYLWLKEKFEKSMSI
jgi:hypothetical protein